MHYSYSSALTVRATNVCLDHACLQPNAQDQDSTQDRPDTRTPWRTPSAMRQDGHQRSVSTPIPSVFYLPLNPRLPLCRASPSSPLTRTSSSGRVFWLPAVRNEYPYEQVTQSPYGRASRNLRVNSLAACARNRVSGVCSRSKGRKLF